MFRKKICIFVPANMFKLLQIMTRTLLITFVTLLLALPSTAQQNRHRGPGCWRTKTAQNKAASRLLGKQKAEKPHYRGQKKGLVILAEFPDKQFKEGHNRQKYNDILNTSGYTTSEGFRGSVSDYFHAQSNGLFELTFDVVGPFTTEHDYAYYGENDKAGNDRRPENMIMEMCRAADSLVNYADYDWDGDGEVDEVFVVYAGKGEADGGGAKTIWPHMWTLDDAGKHQTLDGLKINVYACANELKASGTINGIGTFCHEFSHCLGFADLYDISYSGFFGMSDFDIMDAGTYGGNGFCPVGYSAFEKMSCGWQDPIVLGDEDIVVDSLKPMNLHGDFYIIYNDAWPDEYYLIENRQKAGWDEDLPDSGLMISHIDYDEEVWFNNIPNTFYTEEDAKEDGLTCGNDHPRATIFHADNDDDSRYWDSEREYYKKTTLKTDLYPYMKNDSLTATSKPVASLYHPNSLGLKTMMGSILDIHQNSGTDKTMSFRYRALNPVITAIREHQPSDLILRSSKAIYTLDGRSVATDRQSLPHGIYIVDGRKVIK